jgi:hypothetical protein
MKTAYAIKKLTPILDSLLAQKELDDFDVVSLKYQDMFGKKTVLYMEIRACFDRTVKGNELYLAWVTTDKLELVDESGDDVMPESQRKELVKWIDNYVYNELTK